MSNHTPGDWEMVVAPGFGPDDYEGITIESPSTGTIICELAGGLPLIEILGNAKLIEKAPNMYRMLKYLLSNRHKCFIPEDDLNPLLNWTKIVEKIIQDIDKVEPL